MGMTFGRLTKRAWRAGEAQRGATYRVLAIGGVLAASSLASPSSAQGPAAALSGHIAEAISPGKAVEIHLTPAQRAPIPPHVTYVDGQLTIMAENCTLGDILASVRKLTGVQIDVPAAAAGERMAAQLGPGRPREVLGSLLSSTDFNYLMQAADDDQNEIQSILLIPREKKSSSKTDSASAAQSPRRMNRRTVAQAAVETTPEPQVAAPAQEAAPADSSQASLPTAPVEAPIAAPTQAGIKLAPASDTNQQAQTLSPSEQMMQGLQRLYEQRREMTQQQNQQTPKPAGTN